MVPLRQNLVMLKKLIVVAVGMFAFGYALVPMYRAICEFSGINILALGEREVFGTGSARAKPTNTQIDTSRTITVEFDANARGPWMFKPAQSSMQVHPGEMIPSYAPRQAAAHFNKVECFCFNQYTLAPGEKKQWPVVFVIDPKLSKDVSTITLSYTFFEVGSKTPAAPVAAVPADTKMGAGA
jgi:cytochrome c oxidase assembly protein subunit 11